MADAEQTDWQQRLTLIVEMMRDMSRHTDPQEIRGQFVSASLFPLLGVSPALGRTFTAEEARGSAQSPRWRVLRLPP